MALGGGTILTPRRKWAAVAVATIVQMASFWLIVYAFVAASVEDGPRPGPPLALGLALVPFAFAALGFLSKNERFGGATVWAMIVSVAVAVPLSALAADAVTGVTAGFGVGGAITLRREYFHTYQSRIIAVVLATTYVFVLLRVAPVAGLVGASVLPFMSVAIADLVVEWRVQSREGES